MGLHIENVVDLWHHVGVGETFCIYTRLSSSHSTLDVFMQGKQVREWQLVSGLPLWTLFWGSSSNPAYRPARTSVTLIFLGNQIKQCTRRGLGPVITVSRDLWAEDQKANKTASSEWMKPFRWNTDCLSWKNSVLHRYSTRQLIGLGKD